MATTPQIVQVADACVAVVQRTWEALTAPLGPPAPYDGVSRVYEVPIADPEFAEQFQGRQVWVFPAEYGRQAFTRGQDNRRPKIAVVIAERYTAQGPVPAQWIDDRVAFVEQAVFTPLADPRQPAIYTGLIPEDDGASVVVYDAELLIFQRLFLSMVTVQYRLLYP